MTEDMRGIFISHSKVPRQILQVQSMLVLPKCTLFASFLLVPLRRGFFVLMPKMFPQATHTDMQLATETVSWSHPTNAEWRNLF